MSEKAAVHRNSSVISRISTILRSSRRRPTVALSTAEPPDALSSTTEKASDGAIEKSSPTSSSGPTSASIRSNAHEEELDRRRYVQTLPPWVHSLREGEDHEEAYSTSQLLPRDPPKAKDPNHHYLPAPKPNHVKGRRYDHQRTREPVIMKSPQMREATQWRSFVKASELRPFAGERSEVVKEEWMKDNFPDLEGPWNPNGRPIGSEKSEGIWLFNPEGRSAMIQHFQRIMMRNPFVPLVIRVIVLTFVLVALALGVYIYRESRALNLNAERVLGMPVDPAATGDFICKQQPSTYMAFIVDSIAVIYIVYITYDEYFSKPLGLRRSRDKMRLLFLDLLFIVFSAANLSLAFNTLTDQQWACFQGTPADLNYNNEEAARSTCVYNAELCRRQRALVSVLLIAEIAWVMTFAISTLRVVERISR